MEIGNHTYTKVDLPHKSPIGRLTKNHLIRTKLNRFNWMKIKHLYLNQHGFYFIQAKALCRPYVQLNPMPIEKYIRVEDCPYKQQLVKKDIFIHILDMGKY